MKPGMPPHVWVKNRDGTMKLVAREELVAAMEALKDHSNGYQPPKPQEVVRPGLVTAVANVLAAVGIKKTAGCRCGKRQEALDRSTPAWLRRLLAPIARPSPRPSAAARPASSKRSASPA